MTAKNAGRWSERKASAGPRRLLSRWREIFPCILCAFVVKSIYLLSTHGIEARRRRSDRSRAGPRTAPPRPHGRQAVVKHGGMQRATSQSSAPPATGPSPGLGLAFSRRAARGAAPPAVQTPAGPTPEPAARPQTNPDLLTDPESDSPAARRRIGLRSNPARSPSFAPACASPCVPASLSSLGRSNRHARPGRPHHHARQRPQLRPLRRHRRGAALDRHPDAILRPLPPAGRAARKAHAHRPGRRPARNLPHRELRQDALAAVPQATSWASRATAPTSAGSSASPTAGPSASGCASSRTSPSRRKSTSATCRS